MKALMFNVGNYVQRKRSIAVYVLMLSVFLSCIMLAVLKIKQEVLARELSISELRISENEHKVINSVTFTNLTALEDTLMNIVVPVIETGHGADELSLAALDVFVARMDDNLSNKALSDISVMIQRNIGSEHGIEISEAILDTYKMKATKEDNFSFQLNEQLVDDFKFEYQQILALNPNAFYVE